jgi:hypothetical protein
VVKKKTKEKQKTLYVAFLNNKKIKRSCYTKQKLFSSLNVSLSFVVFNNKRLNNSQDLSLSFEKKPIASLIFVQKKQHKKAVGDQRFYNFLTSQTRKSETKRKQEKKLLTTSIFIVEIANEPFRNILMASHVLKLILF